MLRIGITGGIGSGKSIASRLFHALGVPVYDADTARAKSFGSEYATATSAVHCVPSADLVSGPPFFPFTVRAARFATIP